MLKECHPERSHCVAMTQSRDLLFFALHNCETALKLRSERTRQASSSDIRHPTEQMKYSMKPPRLGSCLLASLLYFCLSAGTTTAQNSQHHHAPWNSTVASSQTIHAGGAAIQIDFGPGALDLPHPEVVDWVQKAANAVSIYYGKFPVPRARVLILPAADESGVLSGETWGGVDGFPAFTRMRLGQHTTEQQLADDWTMTHEFVHTALPSLSPNHHWLEEGLATYVEPIARAQAGTLSTQEIWKSMLEGMPQGEPPLSGDGLDNTHTWASTYWGGAIFCLVADVTIRQKTGNRQGLQDALHAIVAAGGTIDRDWPISQALAEGDRATGTSVLTDLYRKMGQGPDPVDLNTVWQQLGVRLEQGSIVFDNHAPLARIRHSITAPRRYP